MSKFVKDLVKRDISRRLGDTEQCLVVDVVGLTANQAVSLRKRLREKQIHLLVVKNSQARRATDHSPLARAFEGLRGSSAVCWGGEDFVALVKEIAELDKSDEYAAFQARGGVLDGEPLTRDRVHEISRWPSRTEQLSILSGQIVSPGAQLASQLTLPGGRLASQVEKLGKEPDQNA